MQILLLFKCYNCNFIMYFDANVIIQKPNFICLIFATIWTQDLLVIFICLILCAIALLCYDFDAAALTGSLSLGPFVGVWQHSHVSVANVEFCISNDSAFIDGDVGVESLLWFE